MGRAPGWRTGSALPVTAAPSPVALPVSHAAPGLPRSCGRRTSPGSRGKLEGHDLVVAFGAAIFRYHEFEEGDYLPAGAELWAVTSDPDEAARAPFGPDPGRRPRRTPWRGSPTACLRRRPTAATALAASAQAVGRGRASVQRGGDRRRRQRGYGPTSTVFAHEWTSGTRHRGTVSTSLSVPGSLFFPAPPALGWGLPAAIGLQLGDPSRRVVAMLGDGALHYTVSALWTAARYGVPVVFGCGPQRDALKKFTQVMAGGAHPASSCRAWTSRGSPPGTGFRGDRVESLPS